MHVSYEGTSKRLFVKPYVQSPISDQNFKMAGDEDDYSGEVSG